MPVKKAKRLIPVDDYIVVSELATREKTKEGVLLPYHDGDEPLQGVVESVGPGFVNQKGEKNIMPVKPGDVVLYHKSVGEKVELEKGPVKVLNVGNIFGILRN